MENAAAALAPADTSVEQAAGNNGATESASWTTGLNEDSLAYVQNKGWDSPDKMLQSYRNLEKFAGGAKNLVEIPGIDADETAMGAFYDRLGRPASASEYGLQLPEGGDQDLMDWFGETSHRYGLSQKQVQGLFKEWNDMSMSRLENFQNEQRVQSETDVANLKREWGANYDSMINAGQLAASNLGYDQASLAELEGQMGTANLLKLFATLGSKMGEDSFVTGNERNGGFGTSPAQAKAQIGELRSDKQFMDAYMSGDKSAIAKMQTLMEKAYG